MNQLTLMECSKRRLDETYLVVYAIKNEINLKKSEYIEKSDIYTLIGIDIKGYKQFINIYQDRTNNKRFCLDCFEALKARGLKNILFLSVDNNKNIKRTACQNIRFLLFKHSANMYFYDTIRLLFNSNSNYISQIEEIYDKIGQTSDYFGFTSFKKREWILILNDLIQLYPKVDLI